MSAITSSRSSAVCRSRPGGDNPRRLHLRQPGNLAQPAHHKNRNALKPGGKALTVALPTEPVVEKHFVHNQRKVELAANLASSSASHGLVKCPVGLFGCTSTIARVRGVIARRIPSSIDLPAMVVNQRRGLQRTSSSTARKSKSG